MWKSSECSLSWLLARHLLACYLEAIRPHLDILSRSRLLPALNSVAVIFPVCLIRSFVPLISPLGLFLTSVMPDSIYPLLFSGPLTPRLPLSWVTFTPSSPSHLLLFLPLCCVLWLKAVIPLGCSPTPLCNISFIRTIKAEHWFPGW